ncbi:protein translocase subunit SecF [Candidatus Falkowbacteria bacterium]|jgi:preprotein translocase subunit SecF|nr:protein translocase subunit SecF [Candidatus Falkowbacteria bacterium]MBT5503257.1 protein translocase subunit SecF [Candidatus Falkowbacteria bacterium]MBT6574256.1 protein translocase subunit SecF [Candidatus Falkowbacteria bacterium]MBT7348160.1 protein translocase subunit SecF [Candidatus Falkowbacteria bacterium]MBT7500779.1 protein translocase subunit SecF [Candidatus Falkowbacteria bacterium]
MYQIIQKRKIWLTLSSCLVGLSIIFIVIFGLNLGIDFTGGSLLEVKFLEDRPEPQAISDIVASVGIEGDIVVQPTGEKNAIIRFQSIEEETHQLIFDKLKESFEDKVQEERYEAIGPAIGQELKTKAVYSMLVVIIAIVVYVGWAFRKVSYPVKSWKYGVIAIIALVHDLVITLGVFALLGRFMSVEVGLPFVAALLTILGYSVNDSIVVFDRIRENLGRLVKTDFESIVNRSVNETLVRSINTSVTTLLVLLMVFIFGGASIQFFVLALIIGILFGTYSSIFLASPLLVMFEKYWRK